MGLFLINLAALKERLIAKAAELISDGSIHSFMKTKEYQKQIKNQSLWNVSSTYFTKEQYPVSEEMSDEIDRYIVRYGSVAPGPHVFALRDFVYSKVFNKSEMLPAIIEEDDIERNFEKFDEEMDSIDQAFEKIEGKFKSL